MEILKVWSAGLVNLFGDPARESQRIEAAKQSSTRLKAIKSLSLPPVDEEGANHKDLMARTREITNVYPTPSRKDITHHRLEVLSAKLAERQA